MNTTPTQRHEKTIERYKAQADEFIAYVKEKHNIDLSYEAESYADDECCSLELNFGGLYIYSEQLMYNKFAVGFDTYDPGGYWEPPSTDMEEYSTNRNFDQALAEVLALTIQHQYTIYGMEKFMAEEFERSEKYEREIEEAFGRKDQETVEE